MLAILNFDYSVEMILKCVATTHNIISSARGDYKFKDLWDEIVKKGLILPLKGQIFALHELRNIVQHQGSIPSIEDVSKNKTYTQDFIGSVCSEIMNLPFEKLYLSVLIKNEKLRTKILDAEKALDKQELKKCIKLCEEALKLAFFEESDVFELAGELTGYLGASKELKKVISNNYPEQYKEKDYYLPTRDLSRALLQLGQGVASMQFLDEYRIDFLKHRRAFETLNNLSDKELQSFAESSLSFITNLFLKWQEDEILK
ncbi:MAG: hypothetical protein L0196_04335 [candidate division Zixibacteria bacterium]|nr:hypothetical protein [candidate division Zixibacteria bacterium]